jgi:hypothetical protein
MRNWCESAPLCTSPISCPFGRRAAGTLIGPMLAAGRVDAQRTATCESGQAAAGAAKESAAAAGFHTRAIDRSSWPAPACSSTGATEAQPRRGSCADGQRQGHRGATTVTICQLTASFETGLQQSSDFERWPNARQMLDNNADGDGPQGVRTYAGRQEAVRYVSCSVDREAWLHRQHCMQFIGHGYVSGHYRRGQNHPKWVDILTAERVAGNPCNCLPVNARNSSAVTPEAGEPRIANQICQRLAAR